MVNIKKISKVMLTDQKIDEHIKYISTDYKLDQRFISMDQKCN